MTNLVRVLTGMTTALCIGLCGAIVAAEGEKETSGSIGAGGQGLTGSPPDSAKFYEFRDVPTGLVAEQFQFHWAPKPLLYFEINAIDITQEDTRGNVVFGFQDLWKGTITWNDNPRRWGDDTRMLFADKGDGEFTLDDTLQAAVQAAPANVDTTPMDGQWDAGTKGFLIKNAIDQSAQDVDLEFQRRSYGLGFEYTPTRSWTMDASWSRERRKGTNPQPLGMYFSMSPAEVAAPVDFQTNWETVRAEYNRRSWNVGVQLTASQFDTQIDSLTWDNQLSLVDQPLSASLQSIPGHGRLTLWTDNEMVQGTVFGGVNLPGRTRIDGTFSLSRTTQDDEFLPMTINSSIAPQLAALPENSFDGEHRNTLANLRLSGRPLAWFRWSAWGRHYELENESPSLTFAEYVQTDYAIPLCGNANACGATTNRIARRSLPYGYQKDNFGVLAGFMPLSWLDLSVSYDRHEIEREFSAAEDASEDTYKLTADFDVNEWLTIRTTGKIQVRRVDEYDVEYHEESFPIGEPSIAPINEGIRRFTWTDRDRDSVSLQFEVTPAKYWSIYGETTYARDDYYDPETGRDIGDSFTIQEDRNFDTIPETYNIKLAGRTFDKNVTWTFGTAFSPNSRFDIYADYTWERFRYSLETRYRGVSGGIGTDDPLDDWESAARDTYRTATLGANIGLDKNNKWKLGVSGSCSKGTGDITTAFVPGGASSSDTTLTRFPEMETTLTIATLDVTHRIRPNIDYRLRYWYEDWDESNWASDQMRPYMGDPGNDPGSGTSIFLGMDFDSYTYHVVSLMVNYYW